MRLLACGLAIALVTSTSAARGQTAQAAPAPAAASPPPATPARAWQPGDPPPPGFHVEELPHHGLVLAGTIVTAIPYGASVITALSANQQNETGWLFVPFAGPWITMGRRSYGCNPDQHNQTTGQSLTCVADVFVVMGLVVDGVLQLAGGSLLLAGELVTQPGLVPNEATWHVTPMRIGPGEGAGVVGTF